MNDEFKANTLGYYILSHLMESHVKYSCALTKDEAAKLVYTHIYIYISIYRNQLIFEENEGHILIMHENRKGLLIYFFFKQRILDM